MLLLETKVKEIVAEQLGLDISQVRNEAFFAEDLGADSLDVVELVLVLEDEFNIEILDTSAGKIMSVQDAIDFISTQPYSNQQMSS